MIYEELGDLKQKIKAAMEERHAVDLKPKLGSRYVVDIKRMYKRGDTVRMLSDYIGSSLDSKVDSVASNTMALPVVLGVSVLYDKKFSLLLNSNIEYHMPREGDKYALIADVGSGYGNIRSLEETIRGLGAEVVEGHVVVDKSSESEEHVRLKEKLGFPIRPIFDVSEF